MRRNIRKVLCLLLLLLFPMQTWGAVAAEPEPTAQNEKLRLDNENRYEDMEKAYQDGYEPEVSGECVSVILPLLWNGKNEVNTITASLDLGDQNTAPFIFQNYQKTFKKTEEKINDTDQTREVFLIKFVLKLKSDRKNGAYPVQIKTTVQLEEQEIERNFTVYVQINDEKTAEITPTATPEPTPSDTSGISEETDSTVPAAEIAGGGDVAAAVVAGGENKEEKATSEPKVIVAGCKEIPEHIYAGDSVTLKVILKNTNKKKYVQNMTVTAGCEGDGISLGNAVNTQYYEKLGAGKTLEVPVEIQTDKKTEAGKYKLTLELSYDNPDAVTLTATGQIEITIEQKSELTMEIGQIPEEVNAGDRLQIPVQLMNVGRGMVYNARCTVDVPGLQTDKSLFLGNIEGGTAVSGELDAFAGVVNAGEVTPEKRYGRTGGKILLTYEDEDGNSYEETSDIVLTIQPLKIEEKNTDKNGKESNKIGRQFLIGVTAVVGLGIVGVVLPGWIRRRNQGQSYE